MEQCRIESGAWENLALCREIGTAAFYPGKGEPTTEAKLICSACPVRAECLAVALANNDDFGVWGGLSPRERRHLKRREAEAA